MAEILTENQLRTFLPALKNSTTWTMALNTAMLRFEITSRERAAAFLAQVAHESAEFQRLVERLSYSATRLMAVWPRRFPTLDLARPYERQPERLASYVYANRIGNGDAASGDGWRFRGRGILQITGRGNYRACGQALGLPLETRPELLESAEPAALAAAQFWQSRGLNQLADDRSDDNDDEDFVAISVVINGGRAGLPARRAYWARAKAALASLGFVVAVGLGSVVHTAWAQQAIHTDLAPRVVRRAEGQRRYLSDGRFMLLKVGPQTTGANYLFMGAEDLPPGSAIPEHQHEVDEEIVLVHRGRVRVVLNRDTTEAGIGDVIFLPARSHISVRALPPDTATVYFVFPRGNVERCFQAVGRGPGETAPRRPTHADTLEVPPACQMTYY